MKTENRITYIKQNGQKHPIYAQNESESNWIGVGSQSVSGFKCPVTCCSSQSRQILTNKYIFKCNHLGVCHVTSVSTHKLLFSMIWSVILSESINMAHVFICIYVCVCVWERDIPRILTAIVILIMAIAQGKVVLIGLHQNVLIG